MGRHKRKSSNKLIKQLLGLFIVIACLSIGFLYDSDTINNSQENKSINTSQVNTYISVDDIPEYSGQIYVTINNNMPYFEESEYTTKAFEEYSELDNLGRCGVAYANICKEILPTEERGDISEVKPTGWVQAKYEGEYLYNRCHLIGHQLAVEDAN